MDLAQAADIGKVDDLGILPKPLPFGKYYLLEKINTGGMAEVFKAKAFGVEGFERILALKRILPSIAEDEEFISMFIDEAKIAGQLNHANIAQIFDLGKVSEHYFIALEYIPGRDLRAIFDRAVKLGEKLSIAQVCYVTMKLCEGLDYAHNKRDAQGHELGIVHRDISPQNVLISYEGECKLIDFGIAKAHGKSSSTQVGILKGKFSYMSPEQVRGGKIDRRSDIFSLGIVLYELLTLERLFLGSSDFSTLEKIRKVEFSPPTLFNPHIPQELEDIVLKALARDPADRYQSSHEMQDALQKFMFNQGLYYTNKDLASYMKSAFATEISLEQKKLEYYRTLKKEDLDRANNHQAASRNGHAAAPASGDYGELSWDDDESSTNVFDRKTSKEDILAELDEIELPEGDGIAYAKPRANGAADSSPSLEQFRAELPPPRQTASMSPVNGPLNGAGTIEALAGLDGAAIPHGYGRTQPRSNKGIFIALGLVVLLSLGVVAAWLLLGKSGPGYGTVQFDVDPQVPVTIEIDGELLTRDGPQLPPIGLERIVAGENHDYIIRAEGYGEVRGSFVVEADERRPIEVKLAQANAVAGGTGFVLTVTPPEATLTVDGVAAAGASPFERTDLTPGEHKLVVSAPGYKPQERTIRTVENMRENITISLERAEITLSLQSEPDGASYILTDRTTGKEIRRGTTSVSENIPALPIDHQYEIVVSKTGYETATQAWTPPTDKPYDTELVVLKASATPRRDDSSSSSDDDRRTSSSNNSSSSRRDDPPPRKDEPVVRKDPEPKDDSSTTVAKAPGVIKINAKPPADIFIDGKGYGKTPTKVTLPPGTYNIKLVNAAGANETKRVKLDSGQVLTVVHKFVE